MLTILKDLQCVKKLEQEQEDTTYEDFLVGHCENHFGVLPLDKEIAELGIHYISEIRRILFSKSPVPIKDILRQKTRKLFQEFNGVDTLQSLSEVAMRWLVDQRNVHRGKEHALKYTDPHNGIWGDSDVIYACLVNEKSWYAHDFGTFHGIHVHIVRRLTRHDCKLQGLKVPEHDDYYEVQPVQYERHRNFDEKYILGWRLVHNFHLGLTAICEAMSGIYTGLSAGLLSTENILMHRIVRKGEVERLYDEMYEFMGINYGEKLPSNSVLLDRLKAKLKQAKFDLLKIDRKASDDLERVKKGLWPTETGIRSFLFKWKLQLVLDENGMPIKRYPVRYTSNDNGQKKLENILYEADGSTPQYDIDAWEEGMYVEERIPRRIQERVTMDHVNSQRLLIHDEFGEPYQGELEDPVFDSCGNPVFVEWNPNNYDSYEFTREFQKLHDQYQSAMAAENYWIALIKYSPGLRRWEKILDNKGAAMPTKLKLYHFISPVSDIEHHTRACPTGGEELIYDGGFSRWFDFVNKNPPNVFPPDCFVVMQEILYHISRYRDVQIFFKSEQEDIPHRSNALNRRAFQFFKHAFCHLVKTQVSFDQHQKSLVDNLHKDLASAKNHVMLDNDAANSETTIQYGILDQLQNGKDWDQQTTEERNTDHHGNG